MGQDVYSRRERHLGRVQLLGVHRDPKIPRVRFVHESLKNGSELGGLRTRVTRFDEPDAGFEELADLPSSGFGTFQLDQNGILLGPERDVAHGEVCEEGASGDDSWSSGAFLKLHLPPRPAERGDGGYARAEEPVESLLDAVPDPMTLLLVRNETSEVIVVGTGVKAPRVEEVHVGVDVAGDDPFPSDVDDDVVQSGAELRDASEGGYPTVLDLDVGVRERRTAGPVEERSVEENDAGEKPVQTILRGRSGFRCIVRS